MAPTDPHHRHHATAPSAWVRRFAPLVPADGPSGGAVLDVACGGGRHTRLLRRLGRPVTAVDRDVSGLADLAADAGLEALPADLEGGGPWPLGGRRFAGVVVVNYLHRPLFPALLGALEPGGVLIYETFARGNERFGRPRNPDYLLRPGELLAVAAGRLQVVAYEHGLLARPAPAVVQRLCAVNDLPDETGGDGPTGPPVYPLDAAGRP